MISDCRSQFPLNFKDLRIFETSPSVSCWIDAVQTGEGPPQTHTQSVIMYDFLPQETIKKLLVLFRDIAFSASAHPSPFLFCTFSGLKQHILMKVH